VLHVLHINENTRTGQCLTKVRNYKTMDIKTIDRLHKIITLQVKFKAMDIRKDDVLRLPHLLEPQKVHPTSESVAVPVFYEMLSLLIIFHA